MLDPLRSSRSRRSPRRIRAQSIVLTALLASVAAPLVQESARAEDPTQWAGSLQHLSPAQARTLLALSRDFYPQDQLSDAPYQRCVAPYDAAAADPQAKQALEASLQLVEGAARRMGYTQYFEITDEYERLRLAKMLGESPWLRQFRANLRDCLNAQPEVQDKVGKV